jgi:hypothetical protein
MANGGMVTLLWMHGHHHLHSGYWVGFGALLFFGIVPLAALLTMKYCEFEELRRRWRRRHLRVVRCTESSTYEELPPPK